MATTQRTKSEREVCRYLDKLGVPYQLVRRKKHIQVVVAGECVSCISYGNPKGGRRSMKNVFAAIDRKAREVNDTKTTRHNPPN